MPHKEGHLLVDGEKRKKADIEYPLEHGEVLNYTLDGVSIHPVTTRIRYRSQLNLIQLRERKEIAQGFHHEVNGDFKTVTGSLYRKKTFQNMQPGCSKTARNVAKT